MKTYDSTHANSLVLPVPAQKHQSGYLPDIILHKYVNLHTPYCFKWKRNLMKQMI